jgi:hypothetical protein
MRGRAVPGRPRLISVSTMQSPILRCSRPMPRAKGEAPSWRDFQARWESPALGLFHLAASSTAISAGKYCDRAGKWTSLQSSSTPRRPSLELPGSVRRWSSGRRWPALSQSGADRLPPLRRAPRPRQQWAKEAMDTWAPMTFTTAASIGQSPRGASNIMKRSQCTAGARLFSLSDRILTTPRAPV